MLWVFEYFWNFSKFNSEVIFEDHRL